MIPKTLKVDTLEHKIVFEHFSFLFSADQDDRPAGQDDHHDDEDDHPADQDDHHDDQGDHHGVHCYVDQPAYQAGFCVDQPVRSEEMFLWQSFRIFLIYDDHKV